MTSFIIALSLIGILTSAVTAIFGIGGGLLMVAVLTFFLPAKDLIPVHGLIQLASNSSRALFSYKSIKTPLLWPFLFGSIIGTVAVGLVLPQIALPLLSIIIALYILITQWSPYIQKKILGNSSPFIGGFICTGAGLLVGANGPLVVAMLGNRLNGKDELVATSAICILIGHLCKVIWFGATGFNFSDYWEIILCLILAAIAGSYLGTRIRHSLSEITYRQSIKWLLTLLAILMLSQGVWKMLT